jgi:hypothetical protein
LLKLTRINAKGISLSRNHIAGVNYEQRML